MQLAIALALALHPNMLIMLLGPALLYAQLATGATICFV